MDREEKMNSTQKNYDEWSSQYDLNENPTRDLDRKVTIQTLSNYDFCRVLELGCGTGKNTEWLITQSSHVIGLDFSEGMLVKARNKIKSDKVTFIKSDLNNEWAVNDNSFELVTINLTLEHIKELDPIFTQAFSKLKDNGKLFICELHPKKQLDGSKARFSESGSETVLDVYQHLEKDYIRSAENAGFKLIEKRDWFDKKNELLRLISFIFRRN